MIILHNLRQIATGPSDLPLNKNIYKLFWNVRSSFKSVTLASLIPLFKIGRQMIDFYLVSLISLQTSNSFSLKLSSFYGMESAHSLYMFHELRTGCFIKNVVMRPAGTTYFFSEMFYIPVPMRVPADSMTSVCGIKGVSWCHRIKCKILIGHCPYNTALNRNTFIS